MMGNIEIWVIVAVILGIVGRAVLPYLEKAKEAAEAGELVKFELKYLIAPVLTAVVAIYTVPFALEALPEDANSWYSILAFVLSWEIPDKLRLIQKVLVG